MTNIIDNPDLIVEKAAKEDIESFIKMRLAVLYESCKVASITHESENDGESSLEFNLSRLLNQLTPHWQQELNETYARKVKFNVDNYMERVIQFWVTKYTLANVDISDATTEHLN